MVYALLLSMAVINDATSMSEDELKKYFWLCEATSREIMLDDSDAAACSVIYEALKARAFNGDSQALYDWWKAVRDTEQQNKN